MVQSMTPAKPKVALLVTCLVDLFRPSIGFAAVKLIEDAGCEVTVPKTQTCCGQPAYNSGNQKTTIEIARNVINTFEHFDYVVAPSGSCAGMLREHYTRLFDGDPFWKNKSEAQKVLKEKKLDIFFDGCGRCNPHSPNLPG